MNELYNDYDYKNYRKRLVLKLERKYATSVRPWDLSNFINVVSAGYYKYQVLDSVVTALSKGIPPERIFVLDKSFRLNVAYSRHEILSLQKDGLNKLYKIGNPISLFPDEDILVAGLIFKLYKKINNFLLSNKSRRLRIGNIKDSYDSFKKTGFSHSTIFLFRGAVRNLMAGKFASPDFAGQKDQDSLRIALNKLKALKKGTDDEYKEFISLRDNGILNYISDCHLNNRKITFKKEWTDRGFGKKQVLEKYFDAFFSKLKRLSRPIVGIYDKEQNKIRILSISHIHLKKDYLNIKEISHDSPLSVILECSIPLLFMILTQSISLWYALKSGRIEIENLLKKQQAEAAVDVVELERNIKWDYQRKLDGIKSKYKKLFKKFHIKDGVPIQIIDPSSVYRMLEDATWQKYYEDYSRCRKSALPGEYQDNKKYLEKKMRDEMDKIDDEYNERMKRFEKINSEYFRRRLYGIEEKEKKRVYNSSKKNGLID